EIRTFRMKFGIRTQIATSNLFARFRADARKFALTRAFAQPEASYVEDAVRDSNANCEQFARTFSCESTKTLGYFYYVQYFVEDHLAGHILGLCLIGEADTMSHHIVTNRPNIFGNHITSAFDKSIRFCCQ